MPIAVIGCGAPNGGAGGGAGAGVGGGAGGGLDGGAGGGLGGGAGGGLGGGSGGAGGGAGGGSGGGPADAGNPAGTVTGSVNGTVPFGTVSSSWWIGAPDSAATTVVYLFNKPVVCADLAAAGWDTRITNDTQVLEMKMFGTAPATFTVTTSLTPAPGEASVNHTFSRTVSTPTEQFSTAGTVALSLRVPSTRAAGTFSLSFGSNALSGSYDAGFCASGVEP